MKQDVFETGIDYAKDTRNNICVDILFQDDDWDMVITMPDPEKIYEYDEELKANFTGLMSIIELKMGVFLSKKSIL